MNGATKAHPRSVTSLEWRHPSFYLSQDGVNHNVLLLLNNRWGGL
ncbi:hypothetical protein FHW94_003406 [Novosphingobium sp. SG720]|nr:hypothetical protein [Novosphingobium sp. SG720]